MDELTKIEPIPKEVEEWLWKKQCEWLGISNQPERLSVKTLFKGSDSLNSVEIQRGKSEEISPLM